MIVFWKYSILGKKPFPERATADPGINFSLGWQQKQLHMEHFFIDRKVPFKIHIQFFPSLLYFPTGNLIYLFICLHIQ